MDTIATFLIYLLYGLVCGLLGYTGISILRSVIAFRWGKAKGEITYAAIDSKCDEDGCTFMPLIEYKYCVRGKEYHSKRFAFGYIESNDRFLAKAILNKFKNKSYVTVYFDPKNPKNAVLLRGIRIFHLINLVCFVAALCVLHAQK